MGQVLKCWPSKESFSYIWPILVLNVSKAFTAPDYVLIPADAQDKLVEAFTDVYVSTQLRVSLLLS